MRRTMVWYLLLVTAIVCCFLAAGYLRRAVDPENAVLAKSGSAACASASGEATEAAASRCGFDEMRGGSVRAAAFSGGFTETFGNFGEGEPDVWPVFYI